MPTSALNTLREFQLVAPRDKRYGSFMIRAGHQDRQPPPFRTVSSSWRVLPMRVVVFIALAAAYALLPNARPDLTRFNADDSESYLALSYALTHGLGYTRSLVAGLYVPHTTWPPGFPMLLAPLTATTALPLDWLYIKAYMIAIGLSGIALTWFYVRRVTGSVLTADLAALLLYLAPFYWLFSRTAMTEVPTVTFLLLALTLLDLAWAQRRPRASHVAVAGLISGLGMLLRGTNVGLLIVPLAYTVGQRKAVAEPRRRLALLTLHGATFFVPAVLWAVRNRGIDKHNLGLDGIDQFRMLFATSPVDPASPMVTPWEMWTHAIDNVVHRIIYIVPEQILPGLWNAEWWDWHGAPFAAVALTLLAVLATVPRNASGLPLFLTIVSYEAVLGVFVWGGSIRFWVPVTSLMIILITMNLAPFLARLRPHVRLLVLAGIPTAFAANLIVFAQNFEAKPYYGDLGDMVAMFDRVRALQTPPHSVHTGHPLLFTLRTGLAAPLTVSAIGIEPTYTHLILCGSGDNGPLALKAPTDATVALTQGTCRYYALPKPMTERDLAAQ
jgi:hypothetical protein